MISCADFMAEIGNYLDGEVAGEVRSQLEVHLAHCKTCTVVCDSARQTIRVVTESECFELAESALQPLAERIMQRVRAGATGE